MTRRWARSSGHVADGIAAEGRAPTADDVRHLDTCPECFATVRRGRSFDRLLLEAAAGLSSPLLAPEVLTVPMPSIRRPPTPSLTSLGVLVALVVAGCLVAWTVLPRGDREVAATGPNSPSGAGSAAPSPDPHLVVAGGMEWRIDLVGTVIEVHRQTTGAGSSTAPELAATWDLGTFVDGSSNGWLRCPNSDGTNQWIVLGHVAPHYPYAADPSYYPAPIWRVDSGPLFTYTGPPAAGHATPDGLYLYVLDAATFDPSIEITIAAPGGGGGGSFKAGALVPRTTDVRQPSGCFLSG
jgi:hypothetical protein